MCGRHSPAEPRSQITNGLFLVGEPGLEPGTSRSRSARATKLRYSPMAEDSVASQSLYRPLGGASLGFGPGRIQLFQRTPLQVGPAAFARNLFDRGEALGELAIGRTQRLLWVDPLLLRQLGQDVEQVAELLAPLV